MSNAARERDATEEPKKTGRGALMFDHEKKKKK